MTEPHLGGYIPGGDPATFFPDLWRWTVDRLDVRSVVDVGCGEGQAVDFFAGLGCAALGVDGVEQDHARIVQHDFTTAPWPMDVHVEPCDMIWSCEFVEHVEESFIPNFLAAFMLSRKYVLITHAFPGQDGYHHVNCREQEYWIGVMAAIGFHNDEGLTRMTRTIAAINKAPLNHYARSGLVFVRH